MWDWILTLSSGRPRYDTETDNQYSLGQIAYRGFREIMLNDPDWFTLDRRERAAWEIAAISIIETIRAQKEVRILRPRRRKRKSDANG